MRRTWAQRYLRIALLLALVWAAVAYFLAPAYLRRYERQLGLVGRVMTTTNKQGAPGDPINVGLEGSAGDVGCAMRAAGWLPADPLRFGTSTHIAFSVLARRAYLTAPVSPLFYDGRRQDMAYEKAAARSPSRRHHVRFWHVGDALWLGAATFDRSVGFSHLTGEITHHIDADVDAERNRLAADLEGGGNVASSYRIDGVGRTQNGRNGGGDRYFTDGEVVVSRLRSGCGG